MSTVIERIGLTYNYSFWNMRNVVTFSTGNSVAVIPDPNGTTAPSGYGDGTGVPKISVYTSIDRQNWDLRNTVDMPVWGRVTINVGSDGIVGIALYGNDRSMRYNTFNPSNYQFSGWTTVFGALAATLSISDFDLTFTPSNVPVIVVNRLNTTGSTRQQALVYVRRPSDAVWVATVAITFLSTQAPKNASQGVSALGLEGGSATARNLVFAVGVGTGNSDTGVRLCTVIVNESTGGITGAMVRETYAANGVPGSSNSISARCVNLFQSDDNEYTLCVMHSEGTKSMGLTRGTWDGVNWARTMPYTSRTHSLKVVPYSMAVTYSSDRVIFHVAVNSGEALAFTAVISVENVVTFVPARWWDNRSRGPVVNILGGTGPNTEFPYHEALLVVKEGTNKTAFAHHNMKVTPPPKGVVPAVNSVTSSSTPLLRANADLDIAEPQTRVRIRWQFATDVNFTTNFFEYDQDRSRMIEVRNTHLPNTFVVVQDSLPEDMYLPQGVWYVRAAHVNELDEAGTYSEPQLFSISHPPAAANVKPNGTLAIAYSGQVPVSWVFTDPSETDSQTAYQIKIERDSDGALVSDTNRVTSVTARTANAAVPTTYKDTILRVTVRLTDSDNVDGEWSPYSYFLTADRPVADITSLTEGQTITTAIPTITTSVALSGERRIVSGQVTIRKAGQTVHVSPVIPLDLYNGGTFNYVPPIEILQNATSYVFAVTITDSWGLTSVADTVTAVTGWTAPAPAGNPTVSTVPYNKEGQGYVEIKWDETTKDTDFASWNVYRKTNYVHPSTGVLLVEGVWEPLVGTQEFFSNNGNPYIIQRDYTAKSAHQVLYRIEQEVNRFGDPVSSTTATVITVTPVSDSYWLIQPDALEAFRLGGVTKDDYTEDYEQEEFLVIGRGRHVDTGDRLGFAGTLEAKVRDRGDMSARQQRLRLEDIKKGNRRLFLRNPYGDSFRVSVGSMTYSRIAGTGLSEFFDITVPYFEVGE